MHSSIYFSTAINPPQATEINSDSTPRQWSLAWDLLAYGGWAESRLPLSVYGPPAKHGFYR